MMCTCRYYQKKIHQRRCIANKSNMHAVLVVLALVGLGFVIERVLAYVFRHVKHSTGYVEVTRSADSAALKLHSRMPMAVGTLPPT